MTTVWLLESGELHEGGHVISVFATRELAQQVLESYAVSPTRSFSWECKWNEDRTYFKAGCDWWSITERHIHTTVGGPYDGC